MKKIFILGTLLTATTARADMPTLQYALDFYERECGLPPEMELAVFLKEEIDYMAGHPVSTNSIVSEFIPMFAVDAINGGTTYSEQLTTNNIVSVGYLKSTLDLINSPLCCKNGLQFDPDSFSCVGTITCPDGTLFDDVLQMCLAPDDIYDDTYTGTMTSGAMCTPRAYVREETACPAGWERVELSHANILYASFEDYAESQEFEQSLTYSSYQHENAEECGLTLLKTSEVISPIDVCIPPVDGDIAVQAPSNNSTRDWVIGDDCETTDSRPTCATTRLGGYGWCQNSVCTCTVKRIISVTGEFIYSYGDEVTLKRYGTSDECMANCAYDCARAIQAMPGFRRATVAAPTSFCKL